MRYLGTPGTIESFDVVGVASTNDDSSRRWTAEVRGRWPPEVRASDGKGEGAAKVSKALRRTVNVQVPDARAAKLQSDRRRREKEKATAAQIGGGANRRPQDEVTEKGAAV